MGVAGSGKTTVGRALAERMGLPFFDADDFHPPSNRAKMERGEPLTDGDRRPWLEDLARRIARWQADGGAVLACSALKASYRTVLRATAPDAVRLVYLKGDPRTVEQRLAARPGHFFPPRLLSTQFDALEEPGGEAITLDIRAPVEAIVDGIVRRLQPDPRDRG